MTTTRRLIPLLCLLALMAGCGAPAKGTVTDRKATVHCIGNNAISCDPVWKVLVTSNDPSDRHPVYTDRPNYGWVKVTEEEYGRCTEGAAWPDCKSGQR